MLSHLKDGASQCVPMQVWGMWRCKML